MQPCHLDTAVSLHEKVKNKLPDWLHNVTIVKISYSYLERHGLKHEYFYKDIWYTQ